MNAVNGDDPYARFYHLSLADGPRVAEMYQTIGRIVVAWGAAETVLAKLWFHKALEAGKEMRSDKVYSATTSGKLKALRKLIPVDGSRADVQLQRVESAMPDLEPDRHALVHGYLSVTAKGLAVLNLRNDRLAFAIDLPALLAWAIYLADVAHQMFEEATVHTYRGANKLRLPDPVPPLPYIRTSVEGWPR
ncbi:hypothetical protein SAQ01S_08840 [Sphingomonas aquatilis NBRC 16722]|nr:hypothetical protein SAQ01S_08840 [Sphingomonas aquatilis NBRC 16722]